MKRKEAIFSWGLALGALLLAAAPAGATLITVDVNGGGQIMDAFVLDGRHEAYSRYSFSVSQSGIIEDLDLRLALTHTWLEDISVSLESPSGTTANLFSRLGTSQGAEFRDAIFDDDLAVTRRIGSVGSDHSPFTGSYQLQYASDALSAFDGEQAEGVWWVWVTDYAPGDTGSLYKAGDAAAWGTVIGTQLMITIPEPASLALLGLGTLAMLRKSRHAR